MDEPVVIDIAAFQHTPSTRARDPGPPSNPNPPPPAPAVKYQEEPSPHPYRGQTINFTV
ncbi:MAG: hypothetical protein AB7E79_02215 [Rhodospirillaceae bacterium]